jgi:hypothetical protein
LAQYDFDNSVDYSATLSFVRKHFYQPSVDIANNRVSIKTDIDSKPTEVLICDLLGHTIFSGMPVALDENDFIIDLSIAPKSVLIIKILFTDEAYVVRVVNQN